MRQTIEKEFAGAELADPRLEKRLTEIAETMAMKPDRGFPRIFGDESETEAAYRFFSNERVRPEELLKPHVAQTQQRARETKRVIVAHDTTEFVFGGERKQLSRLSGKGRGFLAHMALALDAKWNHPLGVLHCETMTRPESNRPRSRAMSAKDQSESMRWRRAAAATHELLPKAIHVMDREADSYVLLAEMKARGQEYVVRVCYRERRTEEGKIESLLEQGEWMAEREVMLSPRKRDESERHRKRHPPRKSRTARLQMSAQKIRLVRAWGTGKKYPASLEHNLVYVREVDAADGIEPVEWLLYTTLPVSTEEEVLAVVDAYRSRWVIEEYFKALKTGCAFEKRQLESVEALGNALAICIPIAWQLLRLRSVARDEPDAPAERVLTPTQLICLRLKDKKLGKRPTAREAMLAVARLGGFLKRNGEPGWLTLGYGMQDLLMLEAGYLLRDVINP
jgi:hypothetical protein